MGISSPQQQRDGVVEAFFRKNDCLACAGGRVDHLVVGGVGGPGDLNLVIE